MLPVHGQVPNLRWFDFKDRVKYFQKELTTPKHLLSRSKFSSAVVLPRDIVMEIDL